MVFVLSWQIKERSQSEILTLSERWGKVMNGNVDFFGIVTMVFFIGYDKKFLVNEVEAVRNCVDMCHKINRIRLDWNIVWTIVILIYLGHQFISIVYFVNQGHPVLFYHVNLKRIHSRVCFFKFRIAYFYIFSVILVQLNSHYVHVVQFVNPFDVATKTMNKFPLEWLLIPSLKYMNLVL